MILPSVISTFVRVFQLAARFLFDFHLAVFTLFEESVGASRTGHLVLGFTVIAFGNASKAVDKDSPMNQPNRS
jgi:hypothetical protein